MCVSGGMMIDEISIQVKTFQQLIHCGVPLICPIVIPEHGAILFHVVEKEDIVGIMGHNHISLTLLSHHTSDHYMYH